MQCSLLGQYILISHHLPILLVVSQPDVATACLYHNYNKNGTISPFGYKLSLTLSQWHKTITSLLQINTVTPDNFICERYNSHSERVNGQIIILSVHEIYHGSPNC